MLALKKDTAETLVANVVVHLISLLITWANKDKYVRAKTIDR